MNITYGMLIRKIRQDKNLTLSYVCGENLSTAALSKYERGEIDITLSNFLLILDRLSISLEEFLFLANDDLINKEKKFFDKFQEITKNNDSYSLLQLFKQEQNNYLATSNIKHRHNALLAKFNYNSIKNILINDEELNEISSFLLTCNNLGYYELALFGNFLPFLPLKTINLLVEQVYKKSLTLNSVAINQNLTLSLIINIINRLLEEEYYDNINFYLNIAEKLTNNKKLIYEKLYLKFLKGIFFIKLNDTINGKQLCESTIDTFYNLGFYDEVALLTKELEKIVN